MKSLYITAWQQDDAIPRTHQDYEGPWTAYRRLVQGQDPARFPHKSSDAVRVEDKGDEVWHYLPDGWVVVESGAEQSRVLKPALPESTLCHDNNYTFGVVNTIRYTNHRNETAVRRVVPLFLKWGRQDCPGMKPEDKVHCWIMVALDLDKQDIRDFRLDKIEPR